MYFVYIIILPYYLIIITIIYFIVILQYYRVSLLPIHFKNTIIASAMVIIITHRYICAVKVIYFERSVNLIWEVDNMYIMLSLYLIYCAPRCGIGNRTLTTMRRTKYIQSQKE